MGKSINKSSSQVDTITTPLVLPQSNKKGKRSAENEIEKAVSAKKHKVERDEKVTATQKLLKKQPKKVASSSSEDESDESDSDSEPKVVAKKTPIAAKNGIVVPKGSKMNTGSSSSDSSESDSDSDEKPVVKKKQPAAVITAKKSAPADSSGSSESDSDSDDEKPAAALKNGPKQDSSSSEDSDSDSSDEEEVKKALAQPKNAKKKPVESTDSSDSDESSSDEDDAKNVAALPKVQKKPAESTDSSDSDESSSDEDNAAKATHIAASKAKIESSDSDSEEEEDSSDSDEEPKAKKSKDAAAVKPTQAKSSSSDESSDDESSDDEPAKKVQAPIKRSSSSESSDEDESDEDKNEKPSLKTPMKKDTDVEMVDTEKSGASTFQKNLKSPATPQATGSKTLFVANLSYSVEESDVREFFKGVGEVVDVRLASDAEGVFRGFGHVQFATAEAAQKALELHEQELLGRQVRLDLARERERGAVTPQSRENNSFQKGGRAQGQSIFVRGFDTSLGEYEIKDALREHFGSCGEITRLSVPKDYDTGGVKGIAYMDFADSNGFNAALELNNSELGGGYLVVQEAKPRGDSAGGSGGRFDRGGRSGGRGARDGGRFSGQGGRDGGRFSARGGRDGGRGRGRGTPYKPSVTAMASGKKTTFGDD